MAAITTLLHPAKLFGQGPYWVQTAGSQGSDEAKDIATDPAGNSYTIGYFSNTLSFKNGSTLVSAGVTDVFLVKTDDQGVIQWAVRAGGSGPDRGLSVQVDGQGNSYLTGSYSGTANFDGTMISSVSGSEDVFIAKYNTSGNLVWVASAGGTLGETGNAINLDATGHVLVTGQFSGTANFDAFVLTSMIDPATNQPSVDVFTARYDNNGNAIWAERGAAPKTDRGIDVDADTLGNVYVTGQFSDTITFDNTHNNNIQNAIFVVKYDSNGVEQWARIVGGTVQQIAYGIAMDDTANVYLTGDFEGNLLFIGPPNNTLTHTYANRIFVAKYNTAGTYQWGVAESSDNDLTSRNLAVDDSANCYIIGHFGCVLSSFADRYGSGIFNSVAYKDAYAAKFNSQGAWQWARQIGGKDNVLGYGIALSPDQDVHIAGTFRDTIIVPVSGNFTNLPIDNPIDDPATTGAYCGDNSYGQFHGFIAKGNTDVYFANPIDLARQPYDFYARSGGSCSRDALGVCVNTHGFDHWCGDDTLFSCFFPFLYANSLTSSSDSLVIAHHPGPNFTYLWNNGQTKRFTPADSTAWYIVTMTSEDGCYTTQDSFYVHIHDKPPKPYITDDKGVNNMSQFPQPITLCPPDSVLLIGGGYDATHTIQWAGPGFPYVDTNAITASLQGDYFFIVTDSNGCSSVTMIKVNADSTAKDGIPKLYFSNDHDLNDSIDLCQNAPLIVFVYDSMALPNPDPVMQACLFGGGVSLSINPIVLQLPSCPPASAFYPNGPGWYVVTADVVIGNTCEADTFLLMDSIYINMLQPYEEMIVGNEGLCPDDTMLLHTTFGEKFSWQGPPFIGDSLNDSIWVYQPGEYVVYTYDTLPGGCFDRDTIVVELKSAPQITMNPANGVICPNDSVQLTLPDPGNYEWHGPSGIIAGDTSTIFTQTPGFYYCILTDTSGCVLVSVTVEVRQYTTPLLVALPTDLLCPGDSVTLQVITLDSTSINWQAPLSGNSSQQVVGAGGTYTVEVMTCGILTTASITINESNPPANITPSGPVNICQGDSVTLHANGGMNGYYWSPGGQTADSIIVKQAGTYTVATTDTLGCSDTSQPVIVTVSGTASIPQVSDTIICKGDPVLLTVMGSGTLFWYANDSTPTVLQIGNSYQTPALQDTTTFYISATDGICVTSRVLLTVFIDPISEAPAIFSNSPICTDSVLLLWTDTMSGVAYNWSGPNGFTSGQEAPIITGVTSNDAGQYELTLSNTNCSSEVASLTVEILPTPPTPNLQQSGPVCEGEQLVIQSDSIAGGSYQWTGPGGFSDTITQLVFDSAVTTLSGTYELIVSLDGCPANPVSIFAEVKPAPGSIIELLQNGPLCEGASIFLTANVQPPVTGQANYTWSGPNGVVATSTELTITNANTTHSGQYTFSIVMDGCAAPPDSVEVEVNALPSVDLGPDTIVCMNDPLLLQPDVTGTFLWQDGATDKFYSVAETGWYVLEVTDGNGCVADDSVFVEVLNCAVQFSNMFSPNGDGQNDRIQFAIEGYTPILSQIYNRWGNMIYEWDDPEGGWDGTVQPSGKPASEGVYYYIVQLRSLTTDEVRVFTGFLHLIR